MYSWPYSFTQVYNRSLPRGMLTFVRNKLLAPKTFGGKSIVFPFSGSVEYQQGTDLAVGLTYWRTLRNPQARSCAGTGTNLLL
jgi:hypothetical protein